MRLERRLGTREAVVVGLGAMTRRSVPMRAQLAVSAAVLGLVLTVDLRGAVAVSSVAVLTYYAVANASALRLPVGDRRYPPAVAAIGLLGCTALVLSLPPSSVAAGAAVLVGGATLRRVLRGWSGSSPT